MVKKKEMEHYRSKQNPLISKFFEIDTKTSNKKTATDKNLPEFKNFQKSVYALTKNIQKKKTNEYEQVDAEIVEKKTFFKSNYLWYDYKKAIMLRLILLINSIIVTFLRIKDLKNNTLDFEEIQTTTWFCAGFYNTYLLSSIFAICLSQRKSKISKKESKYIQNDNPSINSNNSISDKIIYNL